ncbi:MAG: ParB/RepB/Spo0J family partition protein [Oscillospiraceae bacterium]|nr:ParB/RepB/Spo0J family partition protein [Oscillospiraceae bacterium]
MAAKKSGLGRGLDSLFAESAGNTVSAPTSLRISDIEPDKDQPRKKFEDTALGELADSIKQHGVLQPLVVRPNLLGGYSIIAGERRWRASRLAGLTEVPAIIKDVTDAEAREIALIENLQREDLDPIEEAFGYQQLIESCGYTQEHAADRLGKSRSSVTNSLRLLNLEPSVQHLVHDGTLSTGHAKVLLGLSGREQAEAAEEVVKAGMNVRQTEQYVKKLKKPAAPKPVKLPPALPGEVAIALKEALGTEVRVSYKDGSGTLSIGFYSDEQLRDFANLLGKYKKEKGE